jgi:hypothetical protein
MVVIDRLTTGGSKRLCIAIRNKQGDPRDGLSYFVGTGNQPVWSNLELLRGNLNCLLLGLGCDNTWPSELGGEFVDGPHFSHRKMV